MRCVHGRQRSQCKDCGGSGICEHGRRRTQCKDCRVPGSGTIYERAATTTTIARPITTSSADAARVIFTPEEDADTLCFCGIDRHLPSNNLPFNGVWIGCDSCPRWCHGECAGLDLGFGRGLTKVEADKIDFECRVCNTVPPAPDPSGCECNPLCIRDYRHHGGRGGHCKYATEIKTAMSLADALMLPSEDEESDNGNDARRSSDELHAVPVVGGGVVMVPKPHIKYT